MTAAVLPPAAMARLAKTPLGPAPTREIDILLLQRNLRRVEAENRIRLLPSPRLPVAPDTVELFPMTNATRSHLEDSNGGRIHIGRVNAAFISVLTTSGCGSKNSGDPDPEVGNCMPVGCGTSNQRSPSGNQPAVSSGNGTIGDPTVRLVPASPHVGQTTLAREDLSIDELLSLSARYQSHLEAVRALLLANQADTGVNRLGRIRAPAPGRLHREQDRFAGPPRPLEQPAEVRNGGRVCAGRDGLRNPEDRAGQRTPSRPGLPAADGSRPCGSCFRPSE